ncbi:hypothetical protein [Ornithinimicrobium tianjinense]|uniref:PE-PGRS family protein n=1 Tax=Ornithinimicrobium tianjinense TaxID=1195761 RepID=A0A917F9L2_9MICO|nr:hypothetical protein [Ornithinimicrobium tianjinense]GGF57923.1 hypothetical protein GCM10011366_27130 [Ornithinimicrobium tianjinense]
MGVKVDPDVLAATVVALDTAARELPGLLSRARDLDAAGDVARLAPVEGWATDTSREITKRIGIVDKINGATVTIGGVTMSRELATEIAGGQTPIDDAMIAVALADPDDRRWQNTDPANLKELFEQLQADAIRRLAGMANQEQAEALVEAFGLVNDVAQVGYVSVSSMAAIFQVGGPALANLLARSRIVTPALDALATVNEGSRAAWANRISSALNTLDDYYLRGRTQFKYPGAFVPNTAGRVLTTITPITENFDDWVARMASRTQPYQVQGVQRSTLLARFLQSQTGTRATTWVSGILSTTSGGQLATRLSAITNGVLGRAWTNPTTGATYVRGAGNMLSMANQSGVRTMLSSAGALRVAGAAGSAFATVDGVVGLVNNFDEHQQMWNEGGVEGRAHVVGEYAETAFNASMTAAMVAPNPVTLGLVAVTGVVWAGAEVVEHWDDITAAADQAADWAGDRLEDVAESDLNPMNWF